MANKRLIWDAVGERLYETGVDHGVLYVMGDNNTYGEGIAWNGLTAVNESPSGAEPTALYADNIKYLNLISAEEYGYTIEAYYSPEEFAQSDALASPVAGMTIAQQKRKMFGFVYRSLIGNDTDGQDHGYKLHICYGCQASPSERNHQTVNDSPEATTLSWTVTTTPVNVTGYKPTASIVIDSTKIDQQKLAALEDVLFGKDPTTMGGEDGVAPKLLMPDEVINLLKAGG